MRKSNWIILPGSSRVNIYNMFETTTQYSLDLNKKPISYHGFEKIRTFHGGIVCELHPQSMQKVT